MTRILLVQGANMAFLGRREPELYGTTTAAELDALIHEEARQHGLEVDIRYTHVEGEAVGWIYAAEDDGTRGLIMNPASFNYAGYALRDCVRAVSLPYIEVHMTNVERRGIPTILASEAVGVIAGFGVHSYTLGVAAMARVLAAAAPS